MGFSEIPPPPEERPGEDGPYIQARPPGPQSRTWMTRHRPNAAPMGPPIVPGRGRGVVYATAKGSNVIDVDGNRFVDLAAGFGSMLLGHSHPRVLKIMQLQQERLIQGLGDLYSSDAKIALTERLARLHPAPGAQVILGQSGGDAVTAALKTALLATGKAGIVAFQGGYHGLGYAPLSATSLRASYREPFADALNGRVRFVDFPRTADELELAVERVRFELALGDVGAVLVEPIQGRAGVIVPPSEWLAELGELCQSRGVVLIVDEIWTGLGRCGLELESGRGDGFVPDIVCLGKGLGGGLPISACIGRAELMAAWSRPGEVVHTSTFAGAPLPCATAIALLDTLSREKLPERAASLGRWLLERLRAALEDFSAVREVRGRGLMLGIDLGDRPGAASDLMQELLERGFIVSTGGGGREVLVLTPPLNIAESQLEAFVAELPAALQALGP